jgi:hypothetical protein
MTNIILSQEALEESENNFIDCYGDKLAKIAQQMQPNEEKSFILISMSYNVNGKIHTESSAKILLATREIIEQCNECGHGFCDVSHLDEVADIQSTGRIPLFVRRSFDQNHGDIISEFNIPLIYITSIAKPFTWAQEPIKKIAVNKPTKPLEKDLESDLLNWMHSRGIQSDSQIQTSKHRMDLWIPGKCFMELKKGKVSGDDVCQAIDYCAEYKLPVILVGNHIGDMASRGIEAFNKAVDGDLIAFVQWSAIRTYLKGLMSL